MDKDYYVYILSNQRNGTLYTGITSNLIRRIWEHRNKTVEGFTRKYHVDKLVYFEQYNDPENAIKREKRLKKYNRQWKLELIERENPEWRDLYTDLVSGLPDLRAKHRSPRPTGRPTLGLFHSDKSGNDRCGGSRVVMNITCACEYRYFRYKKGTKLQNNNILRSSSGLTG
jgi:putative endonuclease